MIPSSLAARISVLLFLLALGPAGCVTKSEADAQARKAFMAGQQAALMRMQQNQGLSVTFMGEVAIPVIPWTPDMTLARALVAANYRGAVEPSEILILRAGRAIRIEPRQLLTGEDVPLMAGDMVEIRQDPRLNSPPPQVPSP